VRRLKSSRADIIALKERDGERGRRVIQKSVKIGTVYMRSILRLSGLETKRNRSVVSALRTVGFNIPAREEERERETTSLLASREARESIAGRVRMARL